MRVWILALAAIASSVPAAAQTISMPIGKGLWTNDNQKCATVRYGYVFDGTRWGSLYYYGPTGNLGPAAELRPITQTRTVEGGFTQMQFGDYDGAGYFRVKSQGADRALYRVGSPFREEIQVSDEPLIRCDFKTLSPKMQAAIRRHAPGLAVR
ncbi:hypothetical protein SKP52_11335 [Sphingopyxis fribergensis]|uniref:Secreted protein n=1 Tax=Sphingopyxis fribergensis TaxID=1515612 RepID=A0A0A7PGH1_9SPHN|nr:hypothetical protein [Sphingopyxis fribergensis]AJA09166.1 hypothetical protein SKP52_11335 [Sphingopyxis fribergensis]